MLLPGLNAINMLLLTSCLPGYLLEINRSVNFIKKNPGYNIYKILTYFGYSKLECFTLSALPTSGNFLSLYGYIFPYCRHSFPLLFSFAVVLPEPELKNKVDPV